MMLRVDTPGLEKHLKGHNENYSRHLINKTSHICSELDSGYADPIEVTEVYTGLVLGEEFEPWIPEKDWSFIYYSYVFPDC